MLLLTYIPTRAQVTSVRTLLPTNAAPDHLSRSLAAHVQGSQLVVELISDDATEPEDGGWVDSVDVRHFFQGREPPSQLEGTLYPLHVSRAADPSSASTIVQFYKALFDGELGPPRPEMHPTTLGQIPDR